MTRAAAHQRVKKSYSISSEAAALISKVRKSRKIGSDSETLDQLIREAIEVQRRSKIDAAYKAYYDVATETELEEEGAWAEFGDAQLAALSQ